MKKLKIGFDVHGVIDTHPELYSALSHALVSADHEVHIITGVKEASIKDKLDNVWNIKYTHFFSIYQQMEDQGYTIEHGDCDHPWFDHDTWDKAKAQYCKWNNVDLHIDDSPKYGEHFSTLYLLQRDPTKTPKVPTDSWDVVHNTTPDKPTILARLHNFFK